MRNIFIFSILEYLKKNIIDVLLITSFLFIILIYIVIRDIQIKDKEEFTLNDALKKAKTTDSENIQDELKNESEQFCETHKGKSHILEKKCGSLHEDMCKMSKCCVLANYREGDTKCVAGSKVGPTYESDKSENLHDLQNYYYLNKCYGDNC